jgi:hypothetical protein
MFSPEMSRDKRKRLMRSSQCDGSMFNSKFRIKLNSSGNFTRTIAVQIRRSLHSRTAFFKARAFK